MTDHKQPFNPDAKLGYTARQNPSEAAMLQEIKLLRERVQELEGTVNEALQEFYQTVQNIQSLVYRLQPQDDGEVVVTLMEGKLLKQMHISTDRLFGKTLTELVGAQHADELSVHIEKALQGEDVIFEFGYGRRIFYNSLSPIVVNNRVIEVIGSAVDITELRKVERDRLKLAEDFKKTVRMLPHMIFISQRAGEGMIHFTLNEGALAEEWGITTEKILDKSVHDIFDETNVPMMIEAITQAFSGETVDFTTEAGDRHFHTYMKPIYETDALGAAHLAEVVGFVSEITERKRAEDALHQIAQGVSTATGEAFFHSLVEQLAKVLRVDCALIGTIVPGSDNRVKTIAVYSHGENRENFAFEMTPACVGQMNATVAGEDVLQLTPLVDLEVASFINIPLLDSNQTMTGVLLVVDSKPMHNIELIESMLKIFAIRASAELERKLAEEELVISNAILKATQEAAIDGILIVDGQQKVLHYNTRFIELWQIPEESIETVGIGPIETYVLPKILESDQFADSVFEMKNDPLLVCRDIMHLHNGSIYEMYTQAVLSANGQLYGRIWYFRDVTEQKKHEEQIRHQSYYDALTGLPNRILFQDRLSIAISQASRNDQKLAVLFLDLDRFKLINDTLSHTIGDLLLKEVAARLSDCLHEGDTLCRLGGDQFKIILSDIEQVEDAAKIAQKLTNAFSQPYIVEGHELYITTSIGISIYPDDGMDNKTLVRNANAAMNRAKDHGRNNYQFYTPSINAGMLLEKLSLESDLRKAIERSELYVHYQPRVNLHTNRLIGMEALVRWYHPQQGQISPGKFIPLAEETELIVHIDNFVLRTACAQNKAWQLAGYPPIRVAVNLSARQFQQRDLVETVAQILEETGLEAKYLELEITEGTTMNDAEAAISTICKLKDLGIHIAIDDFGTGYSSLSYLKKFPIDTLKIDQSFVRDISIDLDDAAIVSYIISLGHSLQLNVIAEGVETEEQRQFLSAGKCNEMQGFLYSPPLPPNEFEKMLQELCV